jgi:hypothetical protein
MKLSRTKLLAAYYLLIVVYWLVIYLIDKRSGSANYWYQFFFGLIPLVSGTIGFFDTAKRWGGFKSHLGRALAFLSLGLITWGLGQMVWSYYAIRQITEIPYPSWADAGYVLSWPLWTIGMINLSKATGVKFALRKVRGKLALFVIPVLAAATSYWLLVVVARDGSLTAGEGGLKLFFDLAYPIGDVVILTIALLIFGLSFNYLGGKFKWSILFIIAGFVLNYFTDFSFSYTTTNGTYYNGHWVDLMFPSVMFLLSYGILSFDPNRIKKEAK